jgi:hypothetical protein
MTWEKAYILLQIKTINFLHNSKETGVDENTEKTKCIFAFLEHNAVQN